MAEETQVEVIDAPPEHSTEIVQREQVSIVPVATAADLKARLEVIQEVMQTVMTENVDYGKIPGTNKPTLLKPGAEKLAATFRFDVQTRHTERWGPGDHLTIIAQTIVYDAPTGTRLGSGEGVCSTRERKYAWRNSNRKCPNCEKETIIKGKAEYGGGWLCFAKKGGCGAKFADGDQSIEGQTVGEIENPDLPDMWNTVVKMARKRAIVDAVLLVTGASAIFTQDIEDGPVEAKPVVQPATRENVAELHKLLVSLIGEERAQGLLQWTARESGGVLTAPGVRPMLALARAMQSLTPEAEAPDAQPQGAEEPPISRVTGEPIAF